jgi:serine protease Do
VADEFVRVRLVRITGVDLNLFDFDWDLTWMAFFLSPEEEIYGRYGGRDAAGPDTRNTLAGLRYAMRAALDAHRRKDAGQPTPRKQPPVYVEQMTSARNYRGCIHCHQVKEIRRDDLMTAGKWDRNEVYSYPLPENVGVRLDKDRGNVVHSVTPASSAARAGLQKGDVIRRLNGYNVHSFADAQYALHKAPLKGQIALAWSRGKEHMAESLSLTEGWRKTNITWRPSLLGLLPSLPLNGSNLDPRERRALAVGEKQLAIRLEKPVHSELRAVGLRENDVIVGLNNQQPEMTVESFLAHIRQNYLAGDRITLTIVRDGRRVQLPLRLR